MAVIICLCLQWKKQLKLAVKQAVTLSATFFWESSKICLNIYMSSQKYWVNVNLLAQEPICSLSGVEFKLTTFQAVVHILTTELPLLLFETCFTTFT